MQILDLIFCPPFIHEFHFLIVPPIFLIFVFVFNFTFFLFFFLFLSLTFPNFLLLILLFLFLFLYLKKKPNNPFYASAIDTYEQKKTNICLNSWVMMVKMSVVLIFTHSSCNLSAKDDASYLCSSTHADRRHLNWRRSKWTPDTR